MESNQNIKTTAEKVRNAVKSGLPVSFMTYDLSQDILQYEDNLLKLFLSEIEYSEAADKLCYCIRELSDNAYKANLKRIFFEENNLDLTDRYVYKDNIAKFKDSLQSMASDSHTRQRGLYVKVILRVQGQSLLIEVRNNVELSVLEYKRVHDRLSRCQQYSSIEQGMSEIIDSSEGAGLGLVIMFLTLRKLGLSEEFYSIDCIEGETIANLTLPFNDMLKMHIDEMSHEFVDIIQGLPMFPENISSINSMIQSGKSSVPEIASCIANDVGLTGELLRMVNSAVYGLRYKCSSITDAVKLIGLRGVQNMLYSIGTMQIFNASKDEQKRKMWNHSCKVAFYSSYIAGEYLKDDAYKDIRTDSYVCGLLHDMGKLVFETAHPSYLVKVNHICKNHNVSQNLFETLVAGANHSNIGADVARKWNFPAVITGAIQYHHDCKAAPQEVRIMALLIYTADMLVHYMDGEIEFNQIERAYIRGFNLTSQDMFETLGRKIEKAFAMETRF